FEVEEPELIEIFQNSKNSFSLIDKPCPQDFANNPFLETNPFKLKPTNPFTGLISKNTNSFCGASEELKISVRNALASQKNDGSPLVVSHVKWKVNTVMSRIESKCSIGSSPRCQKLN
ncbi:hypothetical protein AVEN_236866-1, partial [Araneus ventricosus]